MDGRNFMIRVMDSHQALEFMAKLSLNEDFRSILHGFYRPADPGFEFEGSTLIAQPRSLLVPWLEPIFK